MDAAAQFTKQHGRTRFTESEIECMNLETARDTVRLLQYVLDEGIGGDPLEALGGKAYLFFRDFRKAGGQWAAPNSKEGRRSVLSPIQRRIMAALLMGMGQNARLFAAVYADRIVQGSEPPSKKAIEVSVCRMRPMLAAAGFSIQSLYGWGYEIDRRETLKTMIEQYARGSFDFKSLTPIDPYAPLTLRKGAA